MYLLTVLLQYSTVLLYMLCSKQIHEEDHGHKMGHEDGTRTTGTTRELIHGHFKAAH